MDSQATPLLNDAPPAEETREISGSSAGGGDCDNEQSSINTKSKRINVLSFDGGGSRGIMEAMILDDLMRLITLMKRNPNIVSVEILKKDEGRRFTQLLQDVQDPIRPTQIFDLIAGST